MRVSWLVSDPPQLCRARELVRSVSDAPGSGALSPMSEVLISSGVSATGRLQTAATCRALVRDQEAGALWLLLNQTNQCWWAAPCGDSRRRRAALMTLGRRTDLQGPSGAGRTVIKLPQRLGANIPL